MLEATVKAKPRNCWVIDFIKSHPESQIKILYCNLLENSIGVHHFFEIVSPSHLIDNLIRFIHNDPALFDVEVITSKTGRIHASFKMRDHTCGFSKMRGVYLKSAYSTHERDIQWNLLGDTDSIPQMLKQLEADGVKAEVTRLGTFNGEGLLTGRQETILKMALERGYFENPKRIHLRELSKITGASPSALTQILRKGLGKVLREYF